MADDPRLLEAADFVKANVDEPATPADIEVAGDMLRELDLLDPLRALLADKDRAVEFAARSRYEAAVAGWPAAESWDDLDEGVRASWRESVANLRPVLVALREVAGL